MSKQFVAGEVYKDEEAVYPEGWIDCVSGKDTHGNNIYHWHSQVVVYAEDEHKCKEMQEKIVKWLNADLAKTAKAKQLHNNTLDSLAPHGATHYEVEQKGIYRKAGYMRLNQEGVWDFWAEGSECWCEDHQLNKGYSNTSKFIKLHLDEKQ